MKCKQELTQLLLVGLDFSVGQEPLVEEQAEEDPTKHKKVKTFLD